MHYLADAREMVALRSEWIAGKLAVRMGVKSHKTTLRRLGASWKPPNRGVSLLFK